MISSRREVKLMDFGIARMLASESDDHPQIAGTLAYMAPEVLQGEKPDARCDIYALGLTMYELIAGKIAFNSAKASEVIDQHINKAPPPLEECDKALARIVFRCLEKKPNARFQTAGQLRTALGKYLGLDEGDKLSKMKSKMEYEQRKLERDRRQVEIQARQLESERDGARSGSVSVPGPGLTMSDHLRQKDAGFSFPVMLAVVCAVAGFAGAWLKIMLDEGQLIQLASLQTYQVMSWAVLGIFTVSAPAFFRNGILGGLIGAVAGAIGGVLIHIVDTATNEYLLDNEIWVTHFMFTYLAMAVLFSAGAVAVQVLSLKMRSLAKLFLIVTGAALVSAVFPYMKLAENFFGLPLETSIYFYAPLLSTLIWVCLDMMESRLE
ncbi:hypothetical protein MNBD_NITROSPINAE04-935 [hydrothermal vent metagenome]|uniref:Protein kinase domain-containing protein n=1 Tax=hydrothermal vent metagenome TaxID=652676 RepID=A0A3B1CAY0_9ZZZZ